MSHQNLLIKYLNIDLLPLRNDNKQQKRSIYQRKYYLLNHIEKNNKDLYILMSDYQKYIILCWHTKIRQYGLENNSTYLNIKYIYKQIYCDILGYKRVRIL